MNVLITSASLKVSLVKAFQLALAQEGGGHVIAVDASPESPALYFADKAYIVPSGLGQNFISALQHICRDHDVRLLIPTRDEELPFFAEYKELFTHLGVLIMLPNENTIRICQDKLLFAKFCLQSGFSVPSILFEPKNIKQYPVFVRDRFSKGGKGAFRVNSELQLEDLLLRLRFPLVQEYINAPEYTVDLFADLSGQVISVVPRERLAIFGGESFISRTCKNWNILQESIRLAQELGLVGHNILQCFWHEDRVKFIEVNLRWGGGSSLSFAAGAFTPLTAVRLALGREVKPSIGEFQDNYYMLRYTEDVFLGGHDLTQIKLYQNDYQSEVLNVNERVEKGD